MNFPIIFHILGWVLNMEAVLMIPSVITGFIYGDSTVTSFFWAMGLCLIIGIPLTIYKPKDRIFYMREGFVTVALCWIIMSIMGSLPFLFSGSITHPIDALFETVSVLLPQEPVFFQKWNPCQNVFFSGEVLLTGSAVWEF